MLYVICVFCMISSICMGGWLLEVKRISDVSMCNADNNIMLCPLNDRILEGEYQMKLEEKFNKGDLEWMDVMNDYYRYGVTSTEFIYCNEDITRCTLTPNMRGIKYNLIENGVYIGSYDGKGGEKKMYLYFPQELATYILLGGKVRSMEEFLRNTSNVISNFDVKRYRRVSPNDRQKYALEALFVDFPYDGVSMTLRNTIYTKLDINITSEYMKMIQDKIKRDQSLTTFEYFSFFAILSLSVRKVYKILKS